MASTKLNVTKFAAKVVQVAEDLEAVVGRLDPDEVVTRFLDGLSKKLYPEALTTLCLASQTLVLQIFLTELIGLLNLF